MNKDEALEIALDYIRRTSHWEKGRDRHDTLKAVEAALAQPAQEPTNYLHAVLNAYGPDAGISLDQKGWSKLHAAIKAALAQPWPDLTKRDRESYQKGHNDGVAHHKQSVKSVKAAQPVQPERQPLTDEEIQKAIRDWSGLPSEDNDELSDIELCRAIEAAHGIKEKNA